MGFFFNSGFFELVFILVFVLVLGVFVLNILRGIGQWGKNNRSPRLSVDARVVSRRTSVNHHHNAGGVHGEHGYSTSSTSYYVTFEVESGDRMEFCLSGSEYGMLAEGDTGRLSFQGTRYLGFERRPG